MEAIETLEDVYKRQVAGLGFKADVPAVGNIKVRTQQGTDEYTFRFGVTALCEEGQPCLLCLTAGSVVGVELETVRHWSKHQIGVRGFAGEHTRFNGNPTTFCDGLQIG